MQIPAVDAALEECEVHLDSSTSESIRIRVLLTQSLLILICAEFEKFVRTEVKRRCAGIIDVHVAQFVTSCADSVIRSLRISDLSGLLDRFDAECKSDFQASLKSKTKSKNMYDSLISDRHEVAHGGEVKSTLQDVKEYYGHAHVVLDHFREALFRGTTVVRGGANGAA